MDESSNAKSLSPAYLSYATFKNATRNLAAGGRLPNVIDPSVLGALSGSGRQQYLRSLRFFALIDDAGIPSERLRALAEAKEDAQWKPLMAALIRDYYVKQIPLLREGTPRTLRDSFGEIGGIVTPAVRFLLMAAKDAGVEVSPHISGNGGNAGGGRRRKARTDDGGQPNPPAVPPSPLAGLDSFESALLQKFPEFDPAWNEQQQTAWFSTFQQLLALRQKGGTP